MAYGINAEADLESSACGFPREPLAFWRFRMVAGKPDVSRVESIRSIEPLGFTTRDERKLGGCKLRALNPRGYLLVAQGNAIFADQIMGVLTYFRNAGLDVYDYKGYGFSTGKSRLQTIVSDYREFVTALNAQGYRRRYLYGIPMGGVILTNAVGARGSNDALVIDSSSSRIFRFGLPGRIRSAAPVASGSVETDAHHRLTGSRGAAARHWGEGENRETAQGPRAEIH